MVVVEVRRREAGMRRGEAEAEAEAETEAEATRSGGVVAWWRDGTLRLRFPGVRGAAGRARTSLRHEPAQLSGMHMSHAWKGRERG